MNKEKENIKIAECVRKIILFDQDWKPGQIAGTGFNTIGFVRYNHVEYYFIKSFMDGTYYLNTSSLPNKNPCNLQPVRNPHYLKIIDQKIISLLEEINKK